MPQRTPKALSHTPPFTIHPLFLSPHLNSLITAPNPLLEMTNKPVPVGIIRTRPRFDGESPH